MKRILIIGPNNFIGDSVKAFLTSRIPAKDGSNAYGVATLSVKDEEWRGIDFWVCDAVLYCATMPQESEKAYSQEDFVSINCDLAYEVAEKSKRDRVKQFIYVSTIDVYGINSKIGKEIIIDKNTVCRPKTLYAKSKLMAEEKLLSLSDDNFEVVIIRVPMIYGSGCAGEYTAFREYALAGKPLPIANTNRSMLHIDNFCEYLKFYIDNEVSGTFYPQNNDHVSPMTLATKIAEQHDIPVKIKSLPANLLTKLSPSANKMWGGMLYAREISDLPQLTYINFEDSIKKTERKE